MNLFMTLDINELWHFKVIFFFYVTFEYSPSVWNFRRWFEFCWRIPQRFCSSFYRGWCRRGAHLRRPRTEASPQELLRSNRGFPSLVLCCDPFNQSISIFKIQYTLLIRLGIEWITVEELTTISCGWVCFWMSCRRVEGWTTTKSTWWKCCPFCSGTQSAVATSWLNATVTIGAGLKLRFLHRRIYFRSLFSFFQVSFLFLLRRAHCYTDVDRVKLYVQFPPFSWQPILQ